MLGSGHVLTPPGPHSFGRYSRAKAVYSQTASLGLKITLPLVWLGCALPALGGRDG